MVFHLAYEVNGKLKKFATEFICITCDNFNSKCCAKFHSCADSVLQYIGICDVV